MRLVHKPDLCCCCQECSGSHEESANSEFLPAAKEGPAGGCTGLRRPEKPADETREGRNRGGRSSSAGRQGGDNKWKPGGEEESDGGTEASATQEAYLELLATLQEKRGNLRCIPGASLGCKGGWVGNKGKEKHGEVG
ncbi:hypothetical protein NDU88_003886 [Pleurodeles waltl]|uniref:Uncharacterized protein n=1 Tax=Pleurodeles waltl TaxID=8319 RepID=A0AAV7RIQ3_PLEWA|nr:hypothetical protein NDU88_003886 [Pleurodeles waltl]